MTDDRGTDPAEYALGLLVGDDLRAAEARAASDPAFAQEVARWRGRLAPLAEDIEGVRPPASLWPRIDGGLGGAAANDNAVSLRRRVNVWRGLTGAMTALAASLAVVVVNRQSAPPPPIAAPSAQPMVAMIKAGEEVAAVANWDKASRRLLVSEVKMPVVPEHDYQLWLIGADGKPHSVGVMPSVPQMQVALPPPMSAMVAEGVMLAVSLEPVGGSRTGAPTGPVVASGPLATA